TLSARLAARWLKSCAPLPRILIANPTRCSVPLYIYRYRPTVLETVGRLPFYKRLAQKTRIGYSWASCSAISSSLIVDSDHTEDYGCSAPFSSAPTKTAETSTTINLGRSSLSEASIGSTDPGISTVSVSPAPWRVSSLAAGLS